MRLVAKPDMFCPVDLVCEAVLQRKKIHKLCIFGSFDDSEFYSRNRSLIDALAACSDQVVEVRPQRKREEGSNHQRLATAGKLFATVFEILGNFCLWQCRGKSYGRLSVTLFLTLPTSMYFFCSGLCP